MQILMRDPALREVDDLRRGVAGKREAVVAPEGRAPRGRGLVSSIEAEAYKSEAIVAPEGRAPDFGVRRNLVGVDSRVSLGPEHRL